MTENKTKRKKTWKWQQFGPQDFIEYCYSFAKRACKVCRLFQPNGYPQWPGRVPLRKVQNWANQAQSIRYGHPTWPHSYTHSHTVISWLTAPFPPIFSGVILPHSECPSPWAPILASPSVHALQLIWFLCKTHLAIFSNSTPYHSSHQFRKRSPPLAPSKGVICYPFNSSPWPPPHPFLPL